MIRIEFFGKNLLLTSFDLLCIDCKSIDSNIFNIFFNLFYFFLCNIEKKTNQFFVVIEVKKNEIFFTLNEHIITNILIYSENILFLYKGVPYVCWRTTNTIWDVFNFNFSIIILFHHFDSLFFFGLSSMIMNWIELKLCC